MSRRQFGAACRSAAFRVNKTEDEWCRYVCISLMHSYNRTKDPLILVQVTSYVKKLARHYGPVLVPSRLH